MLRRVPRSVEHLDVYVSEIKYFAVPHSAKCILRVGTFVQHVFGARDFGEPSPTGDVIGVQMGVDDVPDLQIVFFGNTDVEFGIINGVAHGARARPPQPKT